MKKRVMNLFGVSIEDEHFNVTLRPVFRDAR